MNRSFFRSAVLGAPFLLVALAAACSPGPTTEIEQQPETPDVVELPADAQRVAGIVTERVEQRPITRVIETTGVITAAQNRVAHVRPLARGIVQDIDVQLGDRVVAGQELIEYDNIELGDLTGEYVEDIGGMARLEARRNVAHRLLGRAQALLAVEAISQSDFDLRQAEYQQAVADLGAQQAELLRIEEKLHRFGVTEEQIEALQSGEAQAHRTASHSALRAPFDGVVTYFDASLGEIIDRERELFTIVDTSLVWVLADIYEKDLGVVVEGVTTEISTPSYPREVFSGALEYVADFLDPESRTAKVRCVVNNRDGRLKLQMYATVAIPVTLTGVVNAVPLTALQTVGSAEVVFVQESSNRFLTREVRSGARGDGWVEVLDGLTGDESVVTVGSFYLKTAVLRGSIGDEH